MVDAASGHYQCSSIVLDSGTHYYRLHFHSIQRAVVRILCSIVTCQLGHEGARRCEQSAMVGHSRSTVACGIALHTHAYITSHQLPWRLLDCACRGNSTRYATGTGHSKTKPRCPGHKDVRLHMHPIGGRSQESKKTSSAAFETFSCTLGAWKLQAWL